VESVEGPLGGADFTWEAVEGGVEIRVKELRLWEMFKITVKN